MAVPPKNTSIDLDAQQDPVAQMQTLVLQLSDFMRDTQTALDGRLSLQNFQRTPVTVTVQKNQKYPISFTNPLPVRPRRLDIAQLTVNDNGPAPTAATTVNAWRLKGATTVEILSLPGLDSAHSYTLIIDVE